MIDQKDSEPNEDRNEDTTIAEAPTQPTPESFSDFELPDSILSNLAEMGWTKPTPVQASCFSILSEGKDLMVQSHTGSGKTGAFCLPWLAKRFDPDDPKKTGVQLLVLLPTRELAKQVCDELSRLAGESVLKLLPVYGGTAMNPQLAALRSGVHAIVGTPGRILDHIRRRSLDLSAVQTVVLDECDEMLSMGFLEDIHNILDECSEKRQTCLFSATLPTDIIRIGNRYMQDPEKVELSGDQVAAAEIKHVYYTGCSGIKTRDLLDVVMVEDPGSTIIFCNTREETRIAAQVLKKAGYSAEALSSDLTQSAREEVMAQMRERNLRFLVATDIAARGIDISHVTHVINYSFPENSETYVHRTGRTGRAGKLGLAISILGPQEIGNFYMLTKQYGSIEFEERQLPPKQELAERRSTLKIDQICHDHSVPVAPEWLLLARDLLGDPRSDRVIAYLLANIDELKQLREQAKEATDESDSIDTRSADETRSRSRGRTRSDRNERSRRGRRNNRRRDYEDDVSENPNSEPQLNEAASATDGEVVGSDEQASDETRRRRRRRRGRSRTRERDADGLVADEQLNGGDQLKSSSTESDTSLDLEAKGSGSTEDSTEADNQEQTSNDDGDETTKGRSRRRRRRRRGRRDQADAKASEETAENPDAEDQANDVEAESSDEQEQQARSGSSSRRRRRRRSRSGSSNVSSAPTKPRVNQDEIVIDIDEGELDAVRGEFGEIDELSDLTLKGRRRALIDEISDDVLIEDLSDEDGDDEDDDRDESEVATIETKHTGSDKTAPDGEDAPASEGDSNDPEIVAKASDAEAAASTSENSGPEESSSAQTSSETREGDSTTESAPSGQNKRRRRRRRKKKNAPPPTPELTCPPHKDFWELWASKYTAKDFEAEPEVDEEEERLWEEEKKERAATTSRRGRGRAQEERKASDFESEVAPSVSPEEFVRMRLNLGRRHGYKSAGIRALLAGRVELKGRAVRDLTVQDGATFFRIEPGAVENAIKVLTGQSVDGGHTLEITRAVDNSSAPALRIDEDPASTTDVNESEEVTELSSDPQSDDASSPTKDSKLAEQENEATKTEVPDIPMIPSAPQTESSVEVPQIPPTVVPPETGEKQSSTTSPLVTEASPDSKEPISDPPAPE